MALYSLSTSAISRKAGRSAVTAAAYRAGVELVDERTGVVHDYTRKRGVEHVELMVPEGITLDSPSALWNAAEAAEKRKDGRPAREILVALPAELDADQRTVLAREITRDLVDRYGVAAQLAIHAPDKAGDQRNHHAHILITTRRYNHDGLGAKSQLEWSATQCKKHKVAKPQDELKALRERWADMQNAALERADCAARVDHRSLAARGIDRVPQIHVGNHGTDMIRQGTPEYSERAMLNLEIIDTNREVLHLRERLDAERAVQEWAEITPATPRTTAVELPEPVPSPASVDEVALARQSARLDARERIEQHIADRHQLQIRGERRALEAAEQQRQQRQAEAEWQEWLRQPGVGSDGRIITEIAVDEHCRRSWQAFQQVESAERAALEKARQEAAEAKAQAEREAAEKARQEAAEAKAQAEREAAEKARPLRDQVRDASVAVHKIDDEIKKLDDERESTSFFKFAVRRELQSKIEQLQIQRQSAYENYAKLQSALDAEKAAEAAQPSGRDRIRQIAAEIQNRGGGSQIEPRRSSPASDPEPRSEKPAPARKPFKPSGPPGPGIG